MVHTKPCHSTQGNYQQLLDSKLEGREEEEKHEGRDEGRLGEEGGGKGHTRAKGKRVFARPFPLPRGWGLGTKLGKKDEGRKAKNCFGGEKRCGENKKGEER